MGEKSMSKDTKKNVILLHIAVMCLILRLLNLFYDRYIHDFLHRNPEFTAALMAKRADAS